MSGEGERETALRFPCSRVVTGGAAYEGARVALVLRGLPGATRAVMKYAEVVDIAVVGCVRVKRMLWRFKSS